MSSTKHPRCTDSEARTVVIRGERLELLDHLQAVLEPVMAALGLVFLGLLLLDYASAGLSRSDRSVSTARFRPYGACSCLIS